MEEVLRRWSPWIRRAVARRIARQEDVDDVVQEVLLVVARHVPALEFPAEAFLLAWLKRVVRSRCLQFWRAGGRYQGAVDRWRHHGASESAAGTWTETAGVPDVDGVALRVAGESIAAAATAACRAVGQAAGGRARNGLLADEVGADEAAVRRNLEVMLRVRWGGEDCLAVARDLGYQGEERRQRARVARQATRGALALWHGTRLAAPSLGPLHQRFLEHLQEWLARSRDDPRRTPGVDP